MGEGRGEVAGLSNGYRNFPIKEALQPCFLHTSLAKSGIAARSLATRTGLIAALADAHEGRHFGRFKQGIAFLQIFPERDPFVFTIALHIALAHLERIDMHGKTRLAADQVPA